MIEARGLSIARGSRRVLHALDLQAQGGEFIALTGLNGAGKSTLLEALAGILRPSEGSCSIQGRDLSQWDRRDLSRAVSYLPQSSGGESHGFRVREVVAMGRFPHTGGWVESPDDISAIDAAMREAQCEPLAARLFHELSGGEKQRVLLAAALAQQTPVLLLDEPAAHVDLPQQLQMYALLRAHAASGKLVVAATHDLRLATLHATRLVLLHGGAIAYDGEPKALFAAPVFAQVFGDEAARWFAS